MRNHDALPREPAPDAGLEADPNEIESLIAKPDTLDEDDGPIIVMAPRPWSPPAAVLPAVLLLLLAGGLMAYRAVGVEDWQGLFTEGGHRLLARAGWSNDAPRGVSPAVKAPKADPEVSDASPVPVEQADAGEPVEEAPAPPEPAAEPKLAETDTPSEPDEAVLDDIQREAERRRAEQEELARLKEKIEAEAPPPRRGGPGMDQRQMLALMDQMKRRHLEMMDRALREMERQQSDWTAGGRLDGAFGFDAFPPLPGFGAGDDVFEDLRRRHAEFIERGERDMARFREQMGRGGAVPFGLPPFAGAFPPDPPLPGLNFDDPVADGAIPPGLVVPEGAQVQTFNGPNGTRGFIMRWGWPPQRGGR